MNQPISQQTVLLAAGGMGMMLALTRKRFGKPKAERELGNKRYGA